MNKKIISTKKAPAAIGPYSQAVIYGDFVFASGSLGLNPESGELLQGVEAQTRQALENIKSILLEESLTMDTIVKTTIFLTDMANFQLVNKIYGEYFESDPPARSCVAVKELPKGGEVEIEVIAGRK